MSSGERPIGAAKGKQSDTEALCQPPPPPELAQQAAQLSHFFGAHPPTPNPTGGQPTHLSLLKAHTHVHPKVPTGILLQPL